jgi:cytochrome P450
MTCWPRAGASAIIWASWWTRILARAKASSTTLPAPSLLRATATPAEPFTREELIDQLGVFFLAGHETTASVLTWVFFILAMHPETLARVRNEVEEVTGGEAVTFEHTKRMPFVRAVFRETLRLYPPITFMPRVALKNTVIGGRKVKRGALVMIAPWTLHRHKRYWTNPDLFDPDRFVGATGKGDRQRHLHSFRPRPAHVRWGRLCPGRGNADHCRACAPVRL